MKIKKNDNVIVIAGKNKGVTGKVAQAFPARNMVLIAGVNIKKKRQKPRKAGEKGQLIEVASPINVSNVMLLDENNKRTRAGFKITGKDKARIAKTTGKTI